MSKIQQTQVNLLVETLNKATRSPFHLQVKNGKYAVVDPKSGTYLVENCTANKLITFLICEVNKAI